MKIKIENKIKIWASFLSVRSSTGPGTPHGRTSTTHCQAAPLWVGLGLPKRCLCHPCHNTNNNNEPPFSPQPFYLLLGLGGALAVDYPFTTHAKNPLLSMDGLTPWSIPSPRSWG